MLISLSATRLGLWDSMTWPVWKEKFHNILSDIFCYFLRLIFIAFLFHIETKFMTYFAMNSLTNPIMSSLIFFICQFKTFTEYAVKSHLFVHTSCIRFLVICLFCFCFFCGSIIFHMTNSHLKVNYTLKTLV